MRITGVGSYQVGKTRSLDLAPVRAAAAIGHEVHPKLSLSKEEGRLPPLTGRTLSSANEASLFTRLSSLSLMTKHVFGHLSPVPPVPWAAPLLTLGASMAVYVAPGGTW